MKAYITADDIANTVRMMRTQHTGTILIVEGHKDMRVFDNLVNKVECKLLPAYGKDNATNALDMLEKDNFDGVLAIVDSDFWKLEGFVPSTPNLLTTDTHDLETMLIASGALDKVLSEYGSSNRIKRLSKPLRMLLLDSGLPLGILRWLSSPTKYNLRLKFKGLTFDRFVDKSTLGVNVDTLINEVKTNSQKTTLNSQSIKNNIIALVKTGHDPWQVCAGHDLVEILLIGFKNVFGNRKVRNITLDLIDSSLRIAYEYIYFSSTQLHKSIKNWERSNSSFKVLGEFGSNQ